MKLYYRYTKFHFSIYPIESCIDYSWCCKGQECLLHWLIKLGMQALNKAADYYDQIWSINHTVCHIVLAINNSFTHDGRMNHLHSFATTQSAE